MIGVVAPDAIKAVVEEFFQLFKTPWEFALPGVRYEVLLITDPTHSGELNARVVIIYGAGEMAADSSSERRVQTRNSGGNLKFGSRTIPLYGAWATFDGAPYLGFEETSRGESLARIVRQAPGVALRLGFNLFEEIGFILSNGQPPQHAATPTVELHISALRMLVLSLGETIVEIPPIPHGHPFAVSLTHDVDHPVFRNHLGDHSMAGFLMRSTIGTLLDHFRGRVRLADVGKNWLAACRCPFVYLGLARDFWRQSLMSYSEIERGLGSTFFVIPFGRRPGKGLNGNGAAKRAAKYELSDIRSELASLTAKGCEVGLHGIDAWHNEAAGRAERDQLATVGSGNQIGVRMHWLYFQQESFGVLDRAGFSYDSTVGYNQTIGFRAGTAQAFRPIGVNQLLELPMHVMDTALFYPSYLHLTFDQAKQAVTKIVDQVNEFGGVMTINWHDRSLAPERLWKDFYVWFVGELKSRNAWFPTAGGAAAWFRKRRSASFEQKAEGRELRVRVSTPSAPNSGPALRLRVHRPARGSDSPNYVDSVLENDEIAVSI